MMMRVNRYGADPAPVRPRDIAPQGARDAGGCRCSVGRLDQCCAAPAGDRDDAASVRSLDVAEVLEDTVYRRFETGGRYVQRPIRSAAFRFDETLLTTASCTAIVRRAGRTVAENEGVTWNADQDVVRPADNPLLATGGVWPQG